MQVIGLVICRTMDWYINLCNILNSYLKNKSGGGKKQIIFFFSLFFFFLDISNYSDPYRYEQNQLRSNGCIIP